MDQIQLMYANFGSRLDHLSDEMCQMDTRIGCVTRQQSHLGGFAHSPSPDPSAEPYNSGDNDSDDASGFACDNEMTVSQ